MAEGRSNASIATALVLTLGTVEKACRQHLRQAGPAGLRNRQPAGARSPALPAVLIEGFARAGILGAQSQV
jgi:hypothetical protein